MFQFDVTIDGNFDRAIEAIGATEAQIRTAAMRALNKTALWLQSKSAKEISDETKIKLQLIRQKLRVIRANRATLKAFIVANLYGIKAIKLGTPRQTTGGVTVGAHKLEGAFVAKMPRSGATTAAGQISVFKRKTRKRLPIREQYVFLDPDASKIIQRNVDDEAAAAFSRYFDHEIQYATSSPQ